MYNIYTLTEGLYLKHQCAVCMVISTKIPTETPPEAPDVGEAGEEVLAPVLVPGHRVVQLPAALRSRPRQPLIGAVL